MVSVVEVKGKSLWKDITNVPISMDGPWSIMGDFNVVRYYFDGIGKQPSTNSIILDYNIALQDSDLFEFFGKGPKYTWNDRQPSEDFMISKTD